MRIHIYILHYLCPMQLMFPYCTFHLATLAQETRLAGQKGSTVQQGLKNGEEREAWLARLIIDGILCDSTTNGECSAYRAFSL